MYFNPEFSGTPHWIPALAGQALLTAQSPIYFLFVIGGASLLSLISEVLLSVIFRLLCRPCLGKSENLQTFQVNCQCEQWALYFY